MKYYIYSHLNPITKEIFYIGLASICSTTNRSINFSQRSKHWKNYVHKYGKPIVEILYDNLTKEEACFKEIELIKKYGRKNIDENGQLVNISLGGEGGRRGSINSPNTRLLSSLKLKGKPKPKGFGLKVSQNRNHVSAGLKVKESNQKHYQLGSERNQKISNKLKGRKVDWTGYPIIQYDLEGNFIKEWSSIRQAGFELSNTQGEPIRKCLKGFQKTAYGFKWKYKK